jgi:hypothetical protein
LCLRRFSRSPIKRCTVASNGLLVVADIGIVLLVLGTGVCGTSFDAAVARDGEFFDGPLLCSVGLTDGFLIVRADKRFPVADPHNGRTVKGCFYGISLVAKPAVGAGPGVEGWRKFADCARAAEKSDFHDLLADFRAAIARPAAHGA